MAKYKVGDKVRVRKDLNEDDDYWMEDEEDYWMATAAQVKHAGAVIIIKEIKSCYYLAEGFNDRDDYWTDEMFEGLVEEIPFPTPDPTPVTVNINITVNNYANACWYCRERGLVDLYLAGRPGICPKCGRAMNVRSD